MKKTLALAAISAVLASTLVACGGHHSPTSPDSTSSTKASTLKNVVVVAIQRFAEGNTVVLNLYGNEQLGLDKTHDPNGANIRLRVYDGASFKTYITGWANSAPIVDTNDTIIRDIVTPGTIDFTLKLVPYDCNSNGGEPKCWIPFTFPNRSVVTLKPDNQYKLVTGSDGDVHIQGALPKVGV